MLVLYSDDVELLRKVSDPVTNIKSYMETVQQMIDVILEHNALGLAAIQVGVSKRIIVLNTLVYSMIPMYNPVITSFRGHPEFEFEGCLSLPGITVSVPRFPEIDLEYMDGVGNIHKDTLTGVSAVVAQHEIDHLNGKLIIDYKKQRLTNEMSKM